MAKISRWVVFAAACLALVALVRGGMERTEPVVAKKHTAKPERVQQPARPHKAEPDQPTTPGEPAEIERRQEQAAPVADAGTRKAPVERTEALPSGLDPRADLRPLDHTAVARPPEALAPPVQRIERIGAAESPSDPEIAQGGSQGSDRVPKDNDSPLAGGRAPRTTQAPDPKKPAVEEHR